MLLYARVLIDGHRWLSRLDVEEDGRELDTDFRTKAEAESAARRYWTQFHMAQLDPPRMSFLCFHDGSSPGPNPCIIPFVP